MSLLFIDGFEHVSSNTDFGRKWTQANYMSVYSPGRNGGQCAKTTGSTYLRLELGANYPTLVFGAAIYFRSTNSQYIVSFTESGANQIRIKTSGITQKLQIYRGSTLLAESADSFALFAWHYLEFKATIDNAAGAYEVRLNGKVMLSASGVDTQDTANAWADGIVTATFDAYMDDLYLCDTAGTGNNNFLGDVKVMGAKPNGAGTYSAWTPSAGANYQCVDEQTPNDDTDYNSTLTAGAKDSYAFEDISLTGTILGVQALALVRKDDAGAHTTQLLTRSGAADYLGPNFTVLDSYKYDRQVQETDPATGAAWSVAGFNAAEFGIDLVS